MGRLDGGGGELKSDVARHSPGGTRAIARIASIIYNWHGCALRQDGGVIHSRPPVVDLQLHTEGAVVVGWIETISPRLSRRV